MNARLDASPVVDDPTELALRLEDEPVAMGVFDAETLRIVAVNEAAVRAYGYSRDEFSAMTIADLHAPEELPRLQADVHAEAVRSSVAADLHDGPIQRLTATAFTLDLLSNALGRGDLAAANDLAFRIRDQLTTEMTSLRQLMNELRTPVPAILPPNTAWRPQPAEVGYAPV